MLALILPPVRQYVGFAAGATPSPTSVTATATPVIVQEPTPPRHYVVLIVIDGARPDYLTGLTKLPHIGALMQHGTVYDRAWVGQLESSTPDVHVTMGTGTLPRENGFLGFGWATPGSRRQVDFRTLLADGQIDPVLRSLPVPSVVARLHQFIPGSKAVAASGHKDYAAVGLGGGFADYELYGKFAPHNQFVPSAVVGHAPPPLTPAQAKSLTLHTPLPVGAEDTWAFADALDVVQRVQPRLLMINVPESDTWGHWYGPDNHAMFQRIMLNIDRGVGQIEDAYQRLGLLKDTDFIVTADHAMMESRAAQNFPAIANAIHAAGGLEVRGDQEGGAIWLKDPTQAKAMAQKLVAMHPDHVMAIFYRSAPGNSYEYLQASPNSWLIHPEAGQALRYLVNTTAGVNGPDLWVLYRENYTVVTRNVTGKWKGTHGGATWQVQHVPLIISGPGVRSGVHSQFPARAIDIAPTIERLLGLPAIHRDGVALADAFTKPLPDEGAAEKAIEPTLAGYVTALREQSLIDDNIVPINWPTGLSPVLPCAREHNPCTTSSTASNQ